MSSSSLFHFAFDNDKFSDRTLCLKSNRVIHKEIHVTKTILSAYSEYFYKLFTNEMKESTQTKIEIDVSLEDAPLFYSLIKSFYTGGLSLDELENHDDEDGDDDFKEIDSLLGLLRIANRFLIEKRYPDILSLLEEEVPQTASNVCYMYTQLEEYEHIDGVEDLRDSFKETILSKFEDFDEKWQTDKFLALPSSLLGEILKNDNLGVTCEATVLQALRKWFNHNPKERVDDLVSLLIFVRFTQIEPTYLSEFLLPSTNFFNTKLKGIKKARVDSIKTTFKSYVDAAIRFHALPRKLRHKSSVSISCLEGGMPVSWQQNRDGYTGDQTSRSIKFEYKEKEACRSQTFFFRGVYMYFSVEFTDQRKCFYLHYCLEETMGEVDKLKRSFLFHLKLYIFNRATSHHDIIVYFTVNGFSSGGLGQHFIDEKLNPNVPRNPYFDPALKTAKLRAYITTIE